MDFNFFKMLYCVVLLCVVNLHLSNGNENAWPKKDQSSKSSRAKAVNSPYRTIDIDNHPQTGYYEGSADQEASGMRPLGSDDEDDMEISGGGNPDVSYTVLTSCQQEQLVAAREGGGAFQPQCTVQGDYEVVQCSAFDCWCVNSQGKEIANTRLQRSLRQLQRLDCFDLELRPVIVVPAESELPPKATNNRDDKHSRERGGPGLGNNYRDKSDTTTHHDQHAGQPSSFQLDILEHPLLLAGIIGGAALGLVCLVLLITFIVYRTRKSDGGGYGVKAPSSSFAYVRAPQYT